jgi:phosphoribosyl 1,2-cyclic phosphodiesterase
LDDRFPLLAASSIVKDQFYSSFFITLLNTCMKKNALTHKQFAIEHQNKRDTGLTDWWLRNNGINAQIICNTHSKLIQAQHEAHLLLSNHIDLLTSDQIKALKNFQRKMNTGHIRKKLKPEAAYTVLNISTKVVRIMHRQAKAK